MTREMLVLKSENVVSGHRQAIGLFLSRWGVVDVITTRQMQDWFARHRVGDRYDLDKQGELSELMKRAKGDYGEVAASGEVRAMSWVQFRRNFREAVYELADGIAAGV